MDFEAKDETGSSNVQLVVTISIGVWSGCRPGRGPVQLGLLAVTLWVVKEGDAPGVLLISEALGSTAVTLTQELFAFGLGIEGWIFFLSFYKIE